MTLTHDTFGRPYAKLSELREGQTVELDGGFTCTTAITVLLRKDERGVLGFTCDEGFHRIDGQADDGEHCIGVYTPAADKNRP
jgi:hypothetical protein